MKRTPLLALLTAALLAACNGSSSPGDPAEPSFSVALFDAGSAAVDNPYFPLVPGTTHLYRIALEDGVETIVYEVLDETRVVAGVTCRVVRDRVYEDELLVEDTHDWYAQDTSGRVWYMGEFVVNYEYDDEDELVGTDNEGSWEAGVDGAAPGIYMKTSFVVGDSYRQEFAPGEAEDMGAIDALDVPVTLADGTAFSCLRIHEWNPLEPDSDEYKYYASGIGLVLATSFDDEEREERIGSFDLRDSAFPDFAGAAFTTPTTIDNLFFPLAPGSIATFERETDEGLEAITSEVLADTRVVNGVTCRVVRVREFLDGLLVEDTMDWYAQDDAGNVWYFGEDVLNYEYDDEGGLLETNDEGSWEAGVDGALPGIVMPASPVPGTSHRQEYAEDEAEDLGYVVAAGVTVVLESGTTFTGCVQMLDWTPLEPDALEYKFYAPGVGLVAEQDVGDDDRVEWVDPD